ncbi:MAG: hypothetical protein M3Q83_05025 [Pseudomonadota bacterium]|nr:hypothetical protein [Pseudomonadota bacterium]
MISLALALAGAAPNLKAVDDGNLALTSCRFAVMRAETSKGFDKDRVAAALASRCTTEEASLRRSMIAAKVARGMSPPAAAAAADHLLIKTRSDLVAQFARWAAQGLLEPPR